MSARETISQHAAQIANRRAQQEIPIMKKYGTNPFVSHADLEGLEIALTTVFDYSSRPEINSQLRRIAKESIDRAISLHMSDLLQDEFLDEIEV